jgi:two-component system alkaline phosphatase synthesis response regulator PhoP
MATILIVDDEPAIRAFVRTALEQAGYRVLEAADGGSALHLVQGEGPDLILLDVALPHLSGIDVCRRLRAQPATARTPVLLLTGLPDRAASDAATAGAQGCLAKPFSPGQLISQVDDALRLTPVP